MRRLLVTGSREWANRTIIADALIEGWRELRDGGEVGGGVVLVHGDCRGADRIAASIWRGVGLRLEPHPARWLEFGRRAGHVRNQAMVDCGADLCLAFILNGSPGATMCATMAVAAGIPVRRFELVETQGVGRYSL